MFSEGGFGSTEPVSALDVSVQAQVRITSYNVCYTKLLRSALQRAGHRVELVSSFRSYERDGDPARQAALRAQGIALGERLAETWQAGPAEARPALWFTYHVYYKAPDWLGPAASRRLGIPYVIAEASHAPKRAASEPSVWRTIRIDSGPISKVR